MLQELIEHLNFSVSGSSSSIRMDYFPYLTERLAGVLASPPNDDANEAIRQVLETLDAYGLSKDDLTESLKELQVFTLVLVAVADVSLCSSMARLCGSVCLRR